MNQMHYNGTPVVRYVLTAILILLLTVLQTTVLWGIELFHVIPNLLLIMVVSYGFLHGDYSALAVGVVCGMLLDITAGRAIGMNTLLCALVAYFCIRISGNLFNNNAFVTMVFVLCFTIPYEFFIYLFYFVIWGKGDFGYALFCKILPSALYNFVFTLVLYPIIRRVSKLTI